MVAIYQIAFLAGHISCFAPVAIPWYNNACPASFCPRQYQLYDPAWNVKTQTDSILMRAVIKILCRNVKTQTTQQRRCVNWKIVECQGTAKNIKENKFRRLMETAFCRSSVRDSTFCVSCVNWVFFDILVNCFQVMDFIFLSSFWWRERSC